MSIRAGFQWIRVTTPLQFTFVSPVAIIADRCVPEIICRKLEKRRHDQASRIMGMHSLPYLFVFVSTSYPKMYKFIYLRISGCTRAAPSSGHNERATGIRQPFIFMYIMFIMATGATHVRCEYSCSITRLSSNRDLQNTTSRKAILFGALALYK